MKKILFGSLISLLFFVFQPPLPFGIAKLKKLSKKGKFYIPKREAAIGLK